MPEVTYDKAKLARLKKAYKAAVKAGVEVFEFEGNEYLVEYAKYLIEYLEAQFKNRR